MRIPDTLPELAIVRVLSAGGPFRVGETISIAFANPTVGRLVAHDALPATERAAIEGPIVPETIWALVTYPAGPYKIDDVLTLSFIDPCVARIHSSRERGGEPVQERPGAVYSLASTPATSAIAATELDEPAYDVSDSGVDAEESPEHVSASLFESRPLIVRSWASTTERAADDAPLVPQEDTDAEPPARAEPERLEGTGSPAGVHVRLEWSGDRVRRFIAVVDKLFTVGRLGWYRHALAMRLLIPDDVSCGDALGDIEAMRHLHALRAAAVETLGRPLLAAFMPNFVVSTEWLATIDSPAAARALAGLRDALTPYVEDDVATNAVDPAWTVGVVERRDLLGASAASVEALLPVLIPTASTNGRLSERLADYRRMLIDVFGQTARSAETVRVNQMAQPNHALDDRLWQLVGAVGEAFDGLAVA